MKNEGARGTADVWLTLEERRVIAGWLELSVPMHRREIAWFELDFDGGDAAKARTLLAKLGVLDTILERSTL
jgi:hypothetical protein